MTFHMLWSSIPKRSAKINACVKIALYDFIIMHPQVVQSPIENDCLNMSIYGHSEKHMVTELLLQVSAQELHNSVVSPPE